MKAPTNPLPILTILLSLFIAPQISAQHVPAIYPLQGFLTDDEGAPIDGEVDIRFRLYDDDGEQLFQEIAAVPVTQGVFSYYLGSQEALDAELFAQVDKLELGVKVGTDTEMTPRMKIGSVPFAARAAYADRAAQADNAGAATHAETADHAQSADSATQAEFAGHALSADSATTVDGALPIYRVTSGYCTEPPGTLSFADKCRADQTNSDQCASCTSFQRKIINCSGRCICVPNQLCPIGPNCSPWDGIPACDNELVGKILPAD